MGDQVSDLYRLLAENATDLVSTHRPDGSFAYATPTWFEFLGENPVGRTPVDFSHPDDAELLATNHRLSLNHTDTLTTLWRCRRDDGSYGWLETKTRPVRDAATGRVTTFVCATRDVTDRRRLQEEFELLHEIVLAVTSAPSLDDALRIALRQLCETTEWSYGEAWFPSPDGASLERSTVWYQRAGTDAAALATASVGLKLLAGEEAAGHAWKAGKVIWVRDAGSSSLARMRRDLEHAAGFNAKVAIPVIAAGSTVAVLLFMMPTAVADDAARIAFVSVVCTQLGAMIARSRIEQARADERVFLAALLDSMSEGIVACDSDGRVTVLNRATREQAGMGDEPVVSREEAVAQYKLFGADGAAHLEPDELPLMRVMRGAEVRDQEFVIETATGQQRTLSANGRLIFDDDGRHLGAVVATRDISHKKELDRMKDEFLSVVSHELRTPLTSIRGSLGLLASGRLAAAPEKARRMIDLAVDNTDRLVRLVNDILDVERIASGTAAIDRAWYDGTELARRVAESLRTVAERAGVELVVGGDETRIFADADRITQTLTNLVDNAIKFSPRGERVEIVARCRTGVAQFEVRDRGRGIPVHKLEAIFDRFQQVDASDAREKGGTGLGLAICRGIVRQHGGRIWAERPDDGGSVFRFTIPLPPAPQSIVA
jgi:PAS domain S-box-containing protein